MQTYNEFSDIKKIWKKGVENRWKLFFGSPENTEKQCRNHCFTL